MILEVLVGIVIVLSLCVFFARKIASTVHAEHTFNAEVDKVWKIWNDPEMIKKWWGPKDFTAPSIQNELRIGGSFLFSMKSPKGETFWNTGSYTEIIPHQRIVSSFSFADETGKPLPGSKVPVPGKWPDEIKITVEFTEIDGKTRVHITEEGIPLIMKLFAKMGWDQQFKKFEELL